MKKARISMLIMIAGILRGQQVFAQQWSGPLDQTSSIGRTGSVGIGIAIPESKLHIYDPNDSWSMLYLKSGAHQVGMAFSVTGYDNYLFYNNWGNLSIRNSTDNRSDLTIDHLGNVGIGTTNPGTKLHVSGTGRFSDYLYFGDSSTQSYLYHNVSDLTLRIGGDDDIAFYVDGQTTPKAIIKASGNMGIGTMTPGTKLHVGGTGRFSDYLYFGNSSTQSYLYHNLSDLTLRIGGDDDIAFYVDGQTTPKAIIKASGNLGIGTTNPAYKLDIGGNSGTHYQNSFRAGYALIGGGSGTDYDFFGYNFAPTITNGAYKYVTSDYASAIKFGSGGFQFLAGASGVSGNSIAVSQVLTIQQGGNIGIGTGIPNSKLNIIGGSSQDVLVLQTNGTAGAGPKLYFSSNSSPGTITPDYANVYIQGYSLTGSDNRMGLKFFTHPNNSTNYTNAMTIDDNGYVGIGNNSPMQILDFNARSKNIRFNYTHVGETSNHAATLVGNNLRVNNANQEQIEISTSQIDAAHGMYMVYNQGIKFLAVPQNHNLVVGTAVNVNNYTKMFIKTDGNVGIGTINPSEKLCVNGKIMTKEIIVTETGWSDFVLEDSYNLPSLEQVEGHIKTNKHLPDIPSAQEVEANGVSLGEMQAKLLKKIEELTLYAIEQQKQIESLKLQMEEMKKGK